MKKEKNQSIEKWKSNSELSQAALARLLGVNRSSVCRRASEMAKTQSGKILIHEPESLSAISEIMDNVVNDLSFNDPTTAEYMEFYRLLSAEARVAFMSRHYAGGRR